MTWFLFGRFGTPSILAIVSRQVPVGQEAPVMASASTSTKAWREPIEAMKAETAWFTKEARRGVELASLPVLQLLAMAVNFPVVAISSQPIFTFPLKSLNDVLADTPFPGSAGTQNGERRSSKSSKNRSASERVLEEVTT